MNNPRNLALAGAGVAAAVYFLPFNVFNTPATQKVGETMSKGGGSPTHAPAISTRRGDLDAKAPHENRKGESQNTRSETTAGVSIVETKEQADGRAGVDSKHFQENVANQAPGQPGVLEKKWNQAHFGTDRGKPS